MNKASEEVFNGILMADKEIKAGGSQECCFIIFNACLLKGERERERGLMGSDDGDQMKKAERGE